MSDNPSSKNLGEKIILLNDFVTPQIREEAFKAESLIKYSAEDNYAGRRAIIPDRLKDLVMSRAKSMGHSFEKYQYGRVRVANHNDSNSFHSLVHTDHICNWVLVLYITNTLFINPEQSGTIFWESNFSKKRKMDLKKPKDVVLHSLILERDTADLTKWTEWLNCPFIENSALLFDSLYFHSPPSPNFDKNSPGKRITIDLFFD